MTTALESPVTAGETALPVRRGRRLWPPFALAFLLGLAAVLAIGAGALYAYDQEYQGRILPGVRVGSIDLSGLSADEAAARLHDHYDNLAAGRAVLVAGDQEIALPFSRARRGPAIDTMVNQALSVGRAGNPVERVIANARTAVRGVVIAPQVRYDQEALTRWVNALAAAQHLAPGDASITRTKTGYEITPSVTGHRADPTTALATLTSQLASLDAPSEIRVELPLVALEPSITTEEANEAVAAADRIAADIRIVHGKESWTIPAATIRTWIGFAKSEDGTLAPRVNTTKIDKALGAVASAVARAPRDASFKFNGSKITGVNPSADGRALDRKATAAEVAAVLQARATGGPTADVAAVLTVAKPALSTEEAKGFAGKMKPISSFSVYYQVIINNHWGGNIEAPATKINGTVVPAGGVFDFWKVVGDLRKLPGAGPGNAIEGGKITVTGAFGGGICTTSTTLFNAAFRAGMVPLARQNHNEYITRYPAGLDATVWIIGSTKQTMSFKNDTQYPIMIQSIITNDGNRRWITFKIWSVPNGRTAKVTNTVIQHGPKAIDTTVKDPTKPVGYTFRNNAPADGAKVWVTVSIYDHGKLHWSKRYFSRYPAVNGVLIVGTKTAS
jgi:vancomycin resistance protein YoaR